MRKLSFILFCLLIVSANYSFAEDHAKVAIEHAKEAASASKPSDVVHHAGAALDQTRQENPNLDRSRRYPPRHDIDR